jgi:hypothetical protein
MFVINNGSVMDVNEEQRKNAREPILFTDGSVMDINEEQSMNASLPILSTEDGSMMDVNKEQPENASLPILATIFPIVKLLKLVRTVEGVELGSVEIEVILAL